MTTRNARRVAFAAVAAVVALLGTLAWLGAGTSGSRWRSRVSVGTRRRTIRIFPPADGPTRGF